MIRALLTPWRWLYSLWLRWCIWEAENHLHACAQDGLIDSLSMREFRGQIAGYRIRLALLNPPATSDATARAKGAREPEVVSNPAAATGGRGLSRKTGA